ncbi:MAG: hypothetical protein KDB00_12370 [Planctomycetales bacterium]|nr:hypothetical protein [Planctomycetales bacterium]
MKLKIFAGLGLVTLLAMGSFYLLNAPGSRNITYPSPNGFDAVAEAGRKMTPVPMDYDSSQDTQALQAYLDANTDPLALLDQAMDQQYMVRMTDSQTMDEILDQSGETRNASRLLYVVARLAELEGRSVDAANALAKIAVIGRRSANGGLLIHAQMAVAIERQGLEGLKQLSQKLPADEKTRIAKLIEAEDTQDIDIDSKIETITVREYDNVKRQSGTLMGSYMIWRLADTEMATEPYDRLRAAEEENRTQRKDLLDLLRQPATTSENPTP